MKTNNFCCVCVERWNYCPVEDKQIFGITLHGFGNRAPMSFENADGKTINHN